MKELLVTFFVALVAGSIINGCMQPSQTTQSPEGQDQATTTGAETAGSALVEDSSDDSFKGDVLGSTTPVLVDFWATWCAPCRSMTPIIDQVASDYAKRLKVVRVDVDANEELTNKYRITSLPTFMMFKDGKQIEAFSGAVSKSELEATIAKHLAPQNAQ